MREKPITEFERRGISGHVLMAALMLIVIITLVGMTALYLASQDVPGVAAMREENVAQQLADAATELVVSWFHDSEATPPQIADLLAKRQGDILSGPSFFDATGRSQFVGTADRPDLLLDAANPMDDRLMNNSPSGFGGPLHNLGRLVNMKVYGPSQPGLLGTLEVTASTLSRKPLARTIKLQLGAVDIPAVRAAVQVGQGLGALRPGGTSPVLVHWGDQRVMGDLAIERIEDLVVKSSDAPVTGQSYDQMGQAQDQWTDYWIGGNVSVLSPPPGPGGSPALPPNVHVSQQPTPGVRLDRWDYDLLKRTAQRHGSYYRLDRAGRLHPPGAPDSDPGLLPSEVLVSSAVGQHHGLLFIDTVDGERPRPDNLGTLILDAGYVEGVLVVQGHVVLRPREAGRSVPVLSPSPEGTNTLGSRIPVQLSDIHLNGLLYAAGTIMLERSVRVYGAVMAGDTVVSSEPGLILEVWYNADLAKGLFRGIPVVYRAPGTWRVKY
jgi:hypothetical protein